MSLLVYGSYGYTGKLVCQRLVEEGVEPVLAGRRDTPLASQAGELGLEYVSLGLEDVEEIKTVLSGVDTLLNCAGPFINTYEPLLNACLETGTHYIDITGEIEVFEGISSYSDKAENVGVMLLPGAGFDVVPSDCLALHLKERLPSATHLALGFDALDDVSPGTALTLVENIDAGCVVRRNGELRRVPAAWRSQEIDFGNGPRTAVTIPWGDVSTAYHSTGIPNIEVYTAVSDVEHVLMRFSRYMGWLLGTDPVKGFMRYLVRNTVSGPDSESRAEGRCYMWGEVRDGGRAVTRLRLPNPYELTVRTVSCILQKVLSGDVNNGFQTPAKLYGADLILEIDGVERIDE